MNLSIRLSHSSGRARGWQAVVFFGFLFFLLSSCAPLPTIPLSERPSRDAMLERLESSRTAFTALKGLGKYRFSQGERSFSATQVLFVQKPDLLRVETIGLFGAPALMLTTDGAQMTALLPGEGKAYQGKADSGLLQRFLQIPLREEDIVSIMLQQPLLTAWDEDSIRYDQDGNSALILTNAYGVRQEVLFDLQLHILRFDYYLADGLQMRLTYDRFDEKTEFPHRFLLHLPLDDLEISFDFSDVELNIAHPDGRFRLTPPAGYVIIPLDKES